MQKTAFLLLLLSTLFAACRKEGLSNSCSNLKEGIAADDVTRVNKAITGFIAVLKSRDYNEVNINTLYRKIASDCGITVETYCFDCIKTLPSQTEIRISLDNAGVTKTKIIDLTYTKNNKIVFRNMHD